MPPHSGLECKPNKQPARSMQQAEFFLTLFLVIGCFSYSPTLKIKAVYSATSVYFYQTTRHHIPEASTLQVGTSLH
jgi:hypothetical protein